MNRQREGFPTTQSACVACGRHVSAALIERDGDVVMRQDCPEHGVAESLFWRDARFYAENLRLASPGRLPPGPLAVGDRAIDEFVTTFAIDVTTRCNLSCPTCFSVGGSSREGDPAVDELLSWIPDYSRRRGFRPNISLVGGESAMRDDLPDIIRGIVRKGLVPRLNSNGLLLTDPARLAALWDAGLRWVILQFDGFSEAASRALRGRDLRAEKSAAIDAMSARGMAIHLAVMVQKGVNDHELADILRFAVGHRRIFRVSFYPRSDVGRFDPSRGAATHVADVAAALEQGSGGEISRDDLLAAKRLWRTLHRLTGHPIFRTRPCIFPFVLLRRGDRLLPVARLLQTIGALAEPRAAWRALRNLRPLARLDDDRFSADVLMVNIEKFYDRAAFDIDQAHNCHHLYLTRAGAFPFCVYNSLRRTA